MIRAALKRIPGLRPTVLYLRSHYEDHFGPPNLRKALADTVRAGEGIEIGGLHIPLRVPGGVRLRYVDRMPVEELRKHYPELANEKLVPVHVIDDGEKLATFARESQDFIIANH